MSLQEELNKIKEGFEAKAPKEALEIMHSSTKELKDSGIMDRIPKVGDIFDNFVRPNQNAKEISSSEILQKGPLLLSFYRGRW